MGKLHELLAVEQDLRGQASKMLAETASVFGKPDFFKGSVFSFTPFDEADAHLAEEKHEELVTTVPDRLAYTFRAIAKYWDAVAQKDATNQLAMADVVLDGEVLVKSVPSTTLLGLESKLVELRTAIQSMPTLDAKTAWERVDNIRQNMFKTKHPTVGWRTQKSTKPVILYEAVVKDGVGIPANVVQVTEDVRVGRTETVGFSGAVTPATASAILSRLDRLIVAVKEARQRANNTEVQSISIGESLLKYVAGTDVGY